MRRLSLPVLLTVGVLLFGCSGAAPKLVLNPVEIDLGIVRTGEVVTMAATIENTGGRTLIVERVSTSCGCTTASVDLESIPPGQVATLEVRFDSGAHGEEFSGPVMRQVFIASNDPSAPEVEFRFRAEVLLETR